MMSENIKGGCPKGHPFMQSEAYNERAVTYQHDTALMMNELKWVRRQAGSGS